MKAKRQTLNIAHDTLSAEKLKEIDAEGYYAVDAWNEETVRYCLLSLHIDPWDYLGYLRNSIKETKLRVTLRGQSLLGQRLFSDETVEAFIAVLADRGVDIIRIYDALNDPRNLESSIRAAKKYGIHAQAAMVYAESPVHSVAFFAGYAAQLAAMGADSLALCGVNNDSAITDLVKAIKNSTDLSLSISASSEAICNNAADAGADCTEIVKNAVWEDDREVKTILAELGHPPIAAPICDIIFEQASVNNSEGRYLAVSDRFKDLVRGKYGRMPAPVESEFSARICGDLPLILVRPADLIEPEYDAIRAKIAPYFEEEEDILTYAVFADDARAYFEYRKAKKYSLDIKHSDPKRGIHAV